MLRHRLSDEQWDCIADLFPPPKNTGRKRSDHRSVFDGILWVLRTGAPWRDIPEELGHWRTIYGLFNDWNADGTLQRILHRLRGINFDLEHIDQDLWCIDGTVTRAHRCASGGGKKKTPPSRPTTPLAAAGAATARKSTC